MKRSRTGQERAIETPLELESINDILREHDSGATVSELSEKYNVSPSVIYFWKSLFIPAFRSNQKLKALEEENERLKQLITDAMSDGLATKANLLSRIDAELESLFRPRGDQERSQRLSDDDAG